jgi:dTDP-4-amino-4,6-dideoxygalactose transaminase
MVAGKEFEYMAAALADGHISGDGKFTKRCNEVLRQLTAAQAALLTTSCTHALELSALLLRLRPGDEVIVPSFTFVSTVNAFVLRGVKPVFVDIRRDTLNIDERLVAQHISGRTKAVVVVHYGGVGAEMDALTQMTSEAGATLIEDNAHGLFGRYRGQPLGSFGSLSTLSFHETKNVHCGEGGAIVINDESLVSDAEVIREKGTDRARFFRGEVDKYTWADLGSSYLPSDLLAAFLCGQLEEAPKLQQRRQLHWSRYAEAFRDWASHRGVQLPSIPSYCEHPAHLFYLLMADLDERQRLIAYLDGLEIHATFHYVPLHSSPHGIRLGGREYDCPVTDQVSDQLVRLPLYPSLTDEEQSRVIEAVLSFT